MTAHSFRDGRAAKDENLIFGSVRKLFRVGHLISDRIILANLAETKVPNGQGPVRPGTVP